MEKKNYRIIYLSNDPLLRENDIYYLQKLGIKEFFLSKTNYKTIDDSWDNMFLYDEKLTLPKEDILLLNEQNWNEEPENIIWEKLNQYFKIAIIKFDYNQILLFSKYFIGVIIIRDIGIKSIKNYSQTMYEFSHSPMLIENIKKCKKRLFFSVLHKELVCEEEGFFKRRTIVLPMNSEYVLEKIREKMPFQETQENSQLGFYAPQIGLSSFFKNLYRKFEDDFSDISIIIIGSQFFEVKGRNFLNVNNINEEYQELSKLKVMFSYDMPKHYLPIEQIMFMQMNKPLVFLNGGSLDFLIKKRLPGCVFSIKHAKYLINQIFRNNSKLISKIIESQRVLLEEFQSTYCDNIWKTNFIKIINEVNEIEDENKNDIMKEKIAIIADFYNKAYLNELLRILQSYFRFKKSMLYDIISLFHENIAVYEKGSRSFIWRTISSRVATSIMHFAGFSGWRPKYNKYLIIDDSIKQLQDCELWIIIANRLKAPLLPLKPFIVVYNDEDNAGKTYIKSTEQERKNMLITLQYAEHIYTENEYFKNRLVNGLGISPNKISLLSEKIKIDKMKVMV